MRESPSPESSEGSSSFKGRKVFVVCGPTASGKSGLADEISSRLTEAGGAWANTVAVDSMQVYREIPTITNQARKRPAEFVGMVSVADEWTVALHRAAAWSVIRHSDSPVVLDAGTGMYLNAVLLDIPLAPRVSPEVRARAEEIVRNYSTPPPNPRRAIREEELRISGAPQRGSIWDGPVMFDATILYLRPEWEVLRGAIDARSSSIARDGLDEASILDEMEREGNPPNPSVEISIGVRELRDHLHGNLPIRVAEERIAIRTRRLARRQIRWFDKLTRNLNGNVRTVVANSPNDPQVTHIMHDIMGA